MPQPHLPHPHPYLKLGPYALPTPYHSQTPYTGPTNSFPSFSFTSFPGPGPGFESNGTFDSELVANNTEQVTAQSIV